jgi:hypothetical protein
MWEKMAVQHIPPLAEYVEGKEIFHVNSAFAVDMTYFIVWLFYGVLPLVRVLLGEHRVFHRKISTSTEHLGVLDLHNSQCAFCFGRVVIVFSETRVYGEILISM